MSTTRHSLSPITQINELLVVDPRDLSDAQQKLVQQLVTVMRAHLHLRTLFLRGFAALAVRRWRLAPGAAEGSLASSNPAIRAAAVDEILDILRERLVNRFAPFLPVADIDACLRDIRTRQRLASAAAAFIVRSCHGGEATPSPRG